MSDRWCLDEGFGITWDAAGDNRLPHSDRVEMSGQRISLMVSYGVDDSGHLALSRKVVWPALRTIPNNTHGSLIQSYGMETTPEMTVNGRRLSPERPRRVRFDGVLTIESDTTEGLAITRRLFPSTMHPVALERWVLENRSPCPLEIRVAPASRTDLARGTQGVYLLEVASDAPAEVRLAPGESVSFGITFSGRKRLDPPPSLDAGSEECRRRAFVRRTTEALRLECPDAALSRAFDFAKLRAAESIFDTAGGLMHSPGGGPYYAAVWCNDEVEYAGPFFPFLGDEAANEASLNAYRLFMPFMGPDYRAIPSSIIAEGSDIWEGVGDRGDAAMYAYGAARFALARGNSAIAMELWPAIGWCLEYCRRQETPEGVIASDTDELEGRFPAGKANLSTSSLAYGGLRSAADLARSLGYASEAEEYGRRADALAAAIESYFGADVEGFRTYRYYHGNEVLRSWICLPLVMGLMARREGTLAALSSPRIWTPDGLATQAGEQTFWDRSTLYGLRAAFFAGDTERALEYLSAYTRRRLVGDHVPYAVEACPEGDQRQLSAESALYCRVITEGLFGIVPTGLRSFRCTPRLPAAWPAMALRSVRAFDREFDLVAERAGGGLSVRVEMAGETVAHQAGREGQGVDIAFR